MRIEELYTYKLLLQAGIYDTYEDWINKKLQEEDPLSDSVLELAICGNNINNIISVLNNLTINYPINKSEVFNSIWTTLRDKYLNGVISKKDCINFMYIIALADGNNLEEPWYTMYMLQDMYEMAMNDYISPDSFNKSFDDFILSKKLYSNTREYKPLKWWQRLFSKNKT